MALCQVKSEELHLESALDSNLFIFMIFFLGTAGILRVLIAK